MNDTILTYYLEPLYKNDMILLRMEVDIPHIFCIDGIIEYRKAFGRVNKVTWYGSKYILHKQKFYNPAYYTWYLDDFVKFYGDPTKLVK